MQRTGITLESGWKWNRHGFFLRLRRIKKLRIAWEENDHYWTGCVIHWYTSDHCIPSILTIEKEVSHGISEIVVKDENNRKVPQKAITVTRVNYVPKNLEDIRTGAEIISTVMMPLESFA